MPWARPARTRIAGRDPQRRATRRSAGSRVSVNHRPAVGRERPLRPFVDGVAASDDGNGERTPLGLRTSRARKGDVPPQSCPARSLTGPPSQSPAGAAAVPVFGAMNATIRKDEPSDEDALVELSLRAWEPVFAAVEEMLGSELLVRLRGDWRAGQATEVRDLLAASDKQVWIADVDRAAVGFVAATLHPDNDVGEIYMIAVDPNVQGQGIGTQLAEVATHWGVASGSVLQGPLKLTVLNHRSSLREGRARCRGCAPESLRESRWLRVRAAVMASCTSAATPARSIIGCTASAIGCSWPARTLACGDLSLRRNT